MPFTRKVLTDFPCCPWINSPTILYDRGGGGRIIKENCASYWSPTIAPTRLDNIGEQNRSKYVNHCNSCSSYFLFYPPGESWKDFPILRKAFLRRWRVSGDMSQYCRWFPWSQRLLKYWPVVILLKAELKSTSSKGGKGNSFLTILPPNSSFTSTN